MDGKYSEYHTKPKLLEQVKRAMHTRNYTPQTITAYIQWIKSFILLHNKTRPADMGKEEMRAYYWKRPGLPIQATFRTLGTY